MEAIRFHGGMRANIPRFRPGQAKRQLLVFFQAKLGLSWKNTLITLSIYTAVDYVMHLKMAIFALLFQKWPH